MNFLHNYICLRRMTRAFNFIVADCDEISISLFASKLLLLQLANGGSTHFSRRGILCYSCI